MKDAQKKKKKYSSWCQFQDFNSLKNGWQDS